MHTQKISSDIVEKISTTKMRLIEQTHKTHLMAERCVCPSIDAGSTGPLKNIRATAVTGPVSRWQIAI